MLVWNVLFRGSGNIYREVTLAPSQLSKSERFNHLHVFLIACYLSTSWIIQMSHRPFTVVTFALEHVPWVCGFVPSSAFSFLGLIFCLYFQNLSHFYRYASQGVIKESRCPKLAPQVSALTLALSPSPPLPSVKSSQFLSLEISFFRVLL